MNTIDYEVNVQGPVLAVRHERRFGVFPRTVLELGISDAQRAKLNRAVEAIGGQPYDDTVGHIDIVLCSSRRIEFGRNSSIQVCFGFRTALTLWQLNSRLPHNELLEIRAA